MKICFNIFVVLLLTTVFVYSNQIAYGINSAKDYYFQFTMFLLITCNLILDIKKKYQYNSISLFDLISIATIMYISLRSLDDVKEFLNFQLLLILYFIIKRQLIQSGVGKLEYDNHRFSVLFVVVVGLTAIAQFIIGVLQAYHFIEPLNFRYIITGTSINPAYYSFYLAMLFPIIFSMSIYLTNSHGLLNKLNVITNIALLCIFAALINTDNRSSWVSVFVSSIIIILYTKKGRDKICEYLRAKKNRILFCLIFILVLILGIVTLYYFKPDSSYGRLLIWKISHNMIFENPVFGIGYNNYEVLYNEYQQLYFASGDFTAKDVQVADYIQTSYNEYLQLLIETGLVGLILFVVSISYLLLKSFKYLNNKIECGNCNYYYHLYVGCFTSIISVLVMSMFSYPLHYLPVKILLIIDLSIISVFTCVQIYKLTNVFNYIKYFYYFAVLILIVYSLINIQHQMKWKSAIKYYENGNYIEASYLYKDIYPHMKTNGLFLLYYGTTMYMCENYNESIKLLEYAKKYTSDPVLYLKLGDNYKAIKQYKLAELNYLYASNIVPNRVYPFFLLALLYSDKEYYHEQKFDEMFSHITNVNPKIDSKAIHEMRDSVGAIKNRLNKLHMKK